MTRPTRLYKYQPFTALTLSNLKRRIWYFCPPEDFNDPFDSQFNLVDYSPEDIERFLSRAEAEGRDTHGVRQQLARDPTAIQALIENTSAFARGAISKSFSNRGVCCFSARLDSLLMWGHYAAGHRGFCLEFDAESPVFERAAPVRYEPTCPPLSVASIALEDSSDFFERGMCSKPADWSYEQEWRLVHAQARTEYCYGTTALTGIYFGARMEFVHMELLALVLKGSITQTFRMELRKSSYGVTALPVKYVPHPEAGGEVPAPGPQSGTPSRPSE